MLLIAVAKYPGFSWVAVAGRQSHSALQSANQFSCQNELLERAKSPSVDLERGARETSVKPIL